MSIRRKFVIALDVTAAPIAALSYSAHRSIALQLKASVPAVEMQFSAIPALNYTHPICAPSCVITRRSRASHFNYSRKTS